jgi:hypothetical protein
MGAAVNVASAPISAAMKGAGKAFGEKATGRPDLTGSKPKGDQTAMPTTPEPNLTAGPKADAYIVRGVPEHQPGRRVFDYRGYRG